MHAPEQVLQQLYHLLKPLSVGVGVGVGLGVGVGVGVGMDVGVGVIVGVGVYVESPNCMQPEVLGLQYLALNKLSSKHS